MQLTVTRRNLLFFSFGIAAASAPFLRGSQSRPGVGTKMLGGKSPPAPGSAAYHSKYGSLEEGFLYFYNLEYARAIQWFRDEVRRNPASAAPYNHLAEAVLYQALFRAGALETQLVSGNNPFLRRAKAEMTAPEKTEFFGAIDKVFAMTGAALATNPNDADAMYARGVAFGLRANYRFFMEKSWREALRDATEARTLHNRVAELRPKFIDARFVQGAHDYLVGSLPFFYKMLGFLVGFRGDREAGIRTLEEVAAKGERVRYDAKVLLCVIYRREDKGVSVKAVPLLRELISAFPHNHLFYLELVQLYSDLGEEANVRGVFQEMEQRMAADPDFFHAMPPARFAYAKGNFQFWYRYYPEALASLKEAVAGGETMDLHTDVLAHMRLGQVYDELGRRAEARKAYEAAVALAPESDVARESRGYLRRPFHRDPP